jgi:hypothetical protein
LPYHAQANCNLFTREKLMVNQDCHSRASGNPNANGNYLGCNKLKRAAIITKKVGADTISVYWFRRFLLSQE